MRPIDADALIDFFSNIQEHFGAERISFRSVNRAIDAMATIDVVPKDFHDKTCEAMAKRHTEEIQRLMPKRGKWNGTVCSECEKDLMDYFYYTEDGGIYELPSLCPNCCARMKGSDDERP